MNNIDVSIIVPVYNVEAYVVECLKSILIQTYDNYEVIIVDDGSTDSSKERILKYIEENDLKHFKYFYKQNGGLSSARNYGLKKSEGKYIWFVDSDDMITLDSLSNLMNLIKKYNADIIRGRYIEFKNKIPKLVHNENYELFENGFDYVKNNIQRQNYQIVVCTSIIKKDLFNRYNLKFEEGIYYEDQCFTANLLLNNNLKIIDSENVVYLYRQNMSSISNTFSLKKGEDMLNVVRSLFDIIDINCKVEKYESTDFYPLVSYAFSYFTYIYNHCSKSEQRKLKKEINLDLKKKIFKINSKRLQTDIQNKLFFISPKMLNFVLNFYKGIKHER